ncbi:MAG: putative phage baseplate protein [Polaromonas sp.]|nr:putative phage baseplate protein [Polaromonas sp.]
MANTKDFATIVSDTITAIQASSARLVDTTIGSMVRAVAEANAAVVLWLQGLMLAFLAMTRASTSAGADLDTWLADYGFSRLAALTATGNCTFSRFTSTGTALVPVGAQVQTADGTQLYTVVADVTNGAYNAGLGGYTMAGGVSSVLAKVQASTAGAAANAVATAINVLSSAIPGIDTVTNVLAFTSGANAESDAAARTRFIAYVASLSKATLAAVKFAVASLQPGMNSEAAENQQYGGATDPGYFYVVVDDGTGAPSTALLAAAATAIDAVRPVTSRFGVYAPVVINAAVTASIAVSAGNDIVAARALVAAAITAYINALKLGQTLTFTRLLQVAYDAAPGVITNVTGMTLNAGTADLASTTKQVIKASTVVIS